MIRILMEISLPSGSIPRVRAQLSAAALPEGVRGRLEAATRTGGCESPAVGGEASWRPCWVSIETNSDDVTALEAPLRRLKEELVAAVRPGGLELFCIPAFAQVGDEYRRLRDVLDAIGKAR
jgi:hypothetical protein